MIIIIINQKSPAVYISMTLKCIWIFLLMAFLYAIDIVAYPLHFSLPSLAPLWGDGEWERAKLCGCKCKIFRCGECGALVTYCRLFLMSGLCCCYYYTVFVSAQFFLSVCLRSGGSYVWKHHMCSIMWIKNCTEGWLFVCAFPARYIIIDGNQVYLFPSSIVTCLTPSKLSA